MKLPQKFDLPCAWKGADLANKTEKWVRELSAGEISEIENAAEQFKQSGFSIEQVSPENFPLSLIHI